MKTRAVPMWVIAAISVVLVGGVFVDPARSEVLRWTAGPHLGWSKMKDADGGSVSLGLATRLRFAERLGAELGVDWRSDDLERGDVKTLPVQVSGLFYLVPALHLTAGVGWYHVRADLGAVVDEVTRFDDSAWDAGLHLGGGVEVPVNEKTDLTAEARYVFLGYELEDIGQTVKVDADFVSFSAGLQLVLW